MAWLESAPARDKVQWTEVGSGHPGRGEGTCGGAQTGSTESKTGDSMRCERWVSKGASDPAEWTGQAVGPTQNRTHGGQSGSPPPLRPRHTSPSAFREPSVKVSACVSALSTSISEREGLPQWAQHSRGLWGLTAQDKWSNH